MSAWNTTPVSYTHLDVYKRQYLALPDTLPESVGELAQQLAGDASNDAEAVLRLAQYLAANTTYSLTPLVPPADEDLSLIHI